MKKKTDFCDGCCYNNHPDEKFNCKKIKCCYLVNKSCVLIEGYTTYEWD